VVFTPLDIAAVLLVAVVPGGVLNLLSFVSVLRATVLCLAT